MIIYNDSKIKNANLRVKLRNQEDIYYIDAQSTKLLQLYSFQETNLEH